MKILVIRTLRADIFGQKMARLRDDFPEAHFYIIAERTSLERFPKDEKFHLLELNSATDIKAIVSLWLRLFTTWFDLVYYGYERPGGKDSVFVDLFISFLLWKRVRIYSVGIGEAAYSSSLLFFFRSVWRLFLLVLSKVFSFILKIFKIKRYGDDIEDKLFFNSAKVLAASAFMSGLVLVYFITGFPILVGLISVLVLMSFFATLFCDPPYVDTEVPDADFFDSQLAADPFMPGATVRSGVTRLKKTIKDETRNCFRISSSRPLELSFPLSGDCGSLKLGAALKTGGRRSGRGRFEVVLGSDTEGKRAFITQKIDTLLDGWNDYELDLSEFKKKKLSSLNIEVKSVNTQEEVYVSYPNITHRANNKNIVVIILDGVIPDHLGIYDKGRTTTPSIDRFFKNGIIFRNAFSQEIWTRPVFASMMTGLYPSHHQLVGKNFFQRLPGRHPLLAEVMKKNGYQTFAYISHRLANQLYGYSRGFDRFIWKQTGRNASCSHIDGILSCYEAMLNNKDSNNVIILHIFDTHMPFFPRSPYYYRDNLSGFEDIRKIYFKQIFEKVPEELQRYYKKSYENKLEEVDMFLGILFDKINSSELRENTHVILTSDHGMTQFEKDSFLKDGSYNLKDARVEVPLLLFSPGLDKGAVVDELVEANVDLYPTLLDIAGIKAKTPFYSRSFFPDPSGKIRGKDFAVSELIYKEGYQIVIRNSDKRYHKICAREPSTGEILTSRGLHESVVDLRTDSEEGRNLLSGDPGLAEVFHKVMKDLKLAEYYMDSEYYRR
jgi:arylsulfatase A-like enzyme